MQHFKMRQPIILLLLLTIGFSACDNSKSRFEKTYIPTDTINSFKIDNKWVTPKKSFEFNSLGKSSGDTLDLVTCCKYVFYPFGNLTDSSSLKNSLLKDFVISDFKRDTFTNSNITPSCFQWSESVELKLDENKLTLFFDNDPEASTHGYIRGGRIVSDKVQFSDDIQIGMRVENFYKKLFDYFPSELE